MQTAINKEVIEKTEKCYFRSPAKPWLAYCNFYEHMINTDGRNYTEIIITLLAQVGAFKISPIIYSHILFNLYWAEVELNPFIIK